MQSPKGVDESAGEVINRPHSLQRRRSAALGLVMADTHKRHKRYQDIVYVTLGDTRHRCDSAAAPLRPSVLPGWSWLLHGGQPAEGDADVLGTPSKAFRTDYTRR